MKLLVAILVSLSCHCIYAQHSLSAIEEQRALYNFTMFCQACHARNGAGTPGNVPRIKDFIGNFLRIKGGREFLVQVPGSALSSLNDYDLAQLINWMLLRLSPNESPKNFQFYNAKEVAKLRSQPLTNVDEVRNALIRRMKEKGIDVAENKEI